jgi:preprotein translocase subunit SecB
MLDIHYTLYPSINLDANHLYDADAVPDFSDLCVSAQLGSSDDDENVFKIMVTVSLASSDSEKIPYSFSVVGISVLECDVDDKEERVVRAAHNGAGIVYAGIREQIAMLSSRSLFGGITLPTYYFSAKDFLDPEDET